MSGGRVRASTRGDEAAVSIEVDTERERGGAGWILGDEESDVALESGIHGSAAESEQALVVLRMLTPRRCRQVDSLTMGLACLHSFRPCSLKQRRHMRGAFLPCESERRVPILAGRVFVRAYLNRLHPHYSQLPPRHPCERPRATACVQLAWLRLCSRLPLLVLTLPPRDHRTRPGASIPTCWLRLCSRLPSTSTRTIASLTFCFTAQRNRVHPSSLAVLTCAC